MNFLRELTLKNFLIYFCIAYTFFDITGAIVAGLNHTHGGIVFDKENSQPVNLVVTVKQDKEK
jgi:hypothetical protein